MGNVLYGIAMLLVIVWAVFFLGFEAGRMIHLLLVIAILLGTIAVMSKSGIN